MSITTGEYAAISTMAAAQAAQLAISNNFANVTTPGYKQDIPQTEQFNDIFVSLLDVQVGIGDVDTSTVIVGSTGGGTELLPMLLDLTQGSMRATGRELDIALAASGFLALQKSDGTTAYTRNGSLRLAIDRSLIDQFGDSILDAAGTPIIIPAGQFTFNSNGTITTATGGSIALAIVDLPVGASWEKAGDNRFVPADPTIVPAQVADPQLRQGFLEQSNVEATDQFARMLSNMRLFEAASSLLSILDEISQTTASSVGSV